jgi:hypothetical protein
MSWFEIGVLVLLFLIWITSRTTFKTTIKFPEETLSRIRDELSLIKDELRQIRRKME